MRRSDSLPVYRTGPVTRRVTFVFVSRMCTKRCGGMLTTPHGAALEASGPRPDSLVRRRLSDAMSWTVCAKVGC